MILQDVVGGILNRLRSWIDDRILFRRLLIFTFILLNVAMTTAAEAPRTRADWNVCPRGVGDVTGSDVIKTAPSNTMTHLLLNATFPCRASVRSWTYFRSRDEPRVFASVWRKEPSADDYFRLVGMNLLPAGDVGWHQVVMVDEKDRIAVEQGDFIGFHHSGADVYRFSQPGAVATEVLTSSTSVSSSAKSGRAVRSRRSELYVTLMAGYYNENFHVDMPQTFHTTDRRVSVTRPLLYAELDYCNASGGRTKCRELPVTVECPVSAPSAAEVDIRRAVYRTRSPSCRNASRDCTETDISDRLMQLCPRQSTCRFDLATRDVTRGREDPRRSAASLHESHIDISYNCQPAASSVIQATNYRPDKMSRQNDTEEPMTSQESVQTITRSDYVRDDILLPPPPPAALPQSSSSPSTLSTTFAYDMQTKGRGIATTHLPSMLPIDLFPPMTGRGFNTPREAPPTHKAVDTRRTTVNVLTTTGVGYTSTATSTNSEDGERLHENERGTQTTTESQNAAEYSMLSVTDLIGVALGTVCLVTCFTGAITACVLRMRRRQMKTSISDHLPPQSHVIEHQLRDNPIYSGTGRPAAQEHSSRLDHSNSLHHQNTLHHHHHQPGQHHHNYEKLDHVVIDPNSASANPVCNFVSLATPTTGFLVAPPTSRDQLARPIVIWAPRSRADESNMAELQVATEHQHGRQCCCCTSGLNSAATSGGGGGYMECDVTARGARHHGTAAGEEDGRHDSLRGMPGRERPGCSRRGNGPYAAMTHPLVTRTTSRLNDWNISAL